MTRRDAGKATAFRCEQRAKARDLIRSVPSSKFKSTREETESKAVSPISRTLEGITMPFGSPKKRTTFAKWVKREPLGQKPRAVRE
jgi:hypothetical protein